MSAARSVFCDRLHSHSQEITLQVVPSLVSPDMRLGLAEQDLSKGGMVATSCRHQIAPYHPSSIRRNNSMSFPIALTVNGVRHEVLLEDPRVTLLDLLRERLHLTGTKKGCDRGQCGACTVLLEGRRVNACLALAVSHDGADVLTVEGLAHGDALHPVQAAFIEHDGFQCGFCTPGQIMSALGVIREAQAGDDPERIREAMSGNLCRCGAYVGITEAVLAAQARMRETEQRGEAA
jgi:xanthine dehydrogenase YagT iron-sulfur-binding subunit